ncbi:MAG: dihydrofolate reductase [Patescibacteria group bacterium]|jgi:dihydrofolate reductase|nr:dihydrofolate reductase [Patescibacteria group bacterium]MDP6756315.1 dihydrofolate reductase [Patescibacteria group bacterium]|tara:strand:- start:6825 stop:7310 length:486 start_codon:yes stop_codon:yes gene_type:complete
MKKPIISAIAAVGKNRELGKSGKIPWYIPGELKHFKEITMGHPVIMGRKTHESIGRALPGRTNIVITRNPDYKAEGCVVVSLIEDAITEAKKHEKEEVFIIGGGEIYKLAWPYIDRLYLTIINKSFEADTFFPEYSEFDKVISRKDTKSDNYNISFLELEK